MYILHRHVQPIRNEKNYDWNQASPNKLSLNDYYDSNQNKYHKLDGTPQSPSTSATNIIPTNYSPSQRYHHHHQFQHFNDRYNMANGNLNTTNNNNNSNNSNATINGLPSVALHPALLNIINESQGTKFRGKYQSTV